MVFTYAFVQKGKNIYSFLRRKNGTIDQLIFGDAPSMEVNHPDLWEKWKQEAAFVDQLDSPDFLFILPQDSSASISLLFNDNSGGTLWNTHTIDAFIEKVIGKKYLSGCFPSAFRIGGVPYRIITYKSKHLPLFIPKHSYDASLIEMKRLISQCRIVITLDALHAMVNADWFAECYYHLVQTSNRLGIAVAEINMLNHKEDEKTNVCTAVLNKYHSVITRYGNPDDIDLIASLSEAIENYSKYIPLVIITNSEEVAFALHTHSRRHKKEVRLYHLDSGVLTTWNTSFG